MPQYRIGKLGKRFVVNIYDDAGKRINRYRLDARNKSEAEREAPGLFSTLTRPKGSTVTELWNGFVADRQGRAIIATMTHTWKAVGPRFGKMSATAITKEDCRAHTSTRLADDIKPGTIKTELGHLRMVLSWAAKNGLIDRAPYIERPTAPKRTERHLTRKQCRALIDSATMPHMKLFIVLALATGGRSAALLELTWDRIDFERGKIDLRNPLLTRPHKGRAIVPMNRTIRTELLRAQDGALSDYVIEWAGRPIKSVKKGLKSSAKAAGIKASVSPHLLRHSVAVHMAEAGIPMEEIAQYLGHENVNVTRNVYARFSPSHLSRAASVLEYDDLGSTNLPSTTSGDVKVPDYMVGATGIEPVTPTMSRNVAARKWRK